MSNTKVSALIPAAISSPIQAVSQAINHSTNQPINQSLTLSIKHFVSHPSLRSFVGLLTQCMWNLLPSNRRVALVLMLAAVCLKLRSFARRGHQPARIKLPLPIDHSVFPQYIVNKDRLWLNYHVWHAPNPNPIGYVFISIAYRSHALRYEQLARYLNVRGYSVFALDHAGHGQSMGDRGYVEHFDDYVEDFLLFVEHVRAGLTPKPSFLLGAGMGGVIAIQVMRAYQEIDEERRRLLASRPVSRSQSINQSIDQPNNLSNNQSTPASAITSFLDNEARAAAWSWTGCILVSPAIIPPPTVSPLSEMLAHLLTDLLPHFGCYSVTDDSKLSRLPAVVAQYAADPLVFKAPMTARWATQMLAVMEELREDSHAITFPFLLLQGTADQWVNPRGADWLFARAQSKDKKMKRYVGAYHDLLHDLNHEQVMDDIYNWMRQRMPEHSE